MPYPLPQPQELMLSPSVLLPSPLEWSMLKEQAHLAVKSGLLPPAINTPEKAIIVALKGRELGIPPMLAFTHIHIIQGKPTISSELMLSLIYRNCPGAVIQYVVNSTEECTIAASRPGHIPMRFSYHIGEAQKAGLLSKESWKKYPAAMLRARTISIVARAVFPDAVMGCSYIPEELGATVNEEGKVLSIPYSDSSRIVPEQPGEGNGSTEELGEYRTPKGCKYAPRKLSEIDLNELRAYVLKKDEQIKLGKVEKPEWWDEFEERATDYIITFENNLLNETPEVAPD